MTTATTDEEAAPTFWTSLHEAFDKLHDADTELRARRREAWDDYVERVDALLEEMDEELQRMAAEK
jgi:hypothetical protein